MLRLSRRQGGGGQGRASLRGTLEGTVGAQESVFVGAEALTKGRSVIWASS